MTTIEIGGDKAIYFAYGTLLELDEIHKYCPTAESLGVFRLKNFRLAFKACGPDPTRGGCTLVEDPGNIMHGILYKMPLAERQNLDKVSGLDQGLWAVRDIILLDSHAKSVAASTYVIPNPSGPHAPPASYTRPILSGAKAIPLQADYIAQLEAIIRKAY